MSDLSNHTELRELPVRGKIMTDVAVIGGGTAGVFAAICAARTGAKTVLVEKNSMLGGTLTVAGVNFPGLFYAWQKQIVAGPCWDALLECVKLGGAKLPELSYLEHKHWREQILVNRFLFTAVITEMCRKAGVRLITNAMLAAASETETGVNLVITKKEGLFEIEAKAAIDATGDANLAMALGLAVEKSETQQPATLQHHLSGYDADKIDWETLNAEFPKWDFPPYITPFNFKHSLRNEKFDFHVPSVNADTSEGKAKVDEDALALTLKALKFCKTIPGLENITVDFCAEETGVRESNRIVGRTVVSAKDYITGHFYPDSVCYAFYPIDLHVMHGVEKTYFEPERVGKVPFAALIPKESKHVLCAGRCISSDTNANSALRVEAVCMATGQAVGCAAALAVKEKLPVYDVPYDALCKALKELGAIVPEQGYFKN